MTSPVSILDEVRVLERACPSGRHLEHPALPCVLVDAIIERDAAGRAAAGRYFDQWLSERFNLPPRREIPEALRGPRWVPGAVTCR